jgi:hypothetical protein
MSELCKKYNLSEDQLKNMVKDGWISISVPHFDEVYSTFKNNLSNSTGREDAVLKTSIQHNCDRTTVYRIIARFE